jgi:hypothetical protein
METIIDLLPILIPIIIIELGMRIYAIVDIVKLDQKGMKTKWNNPVLWIILVAIINFAWVVYFSIGREE